MKLVLYFLWITVINFQLTVAQELTNVSLIKARVPSRRSCQLSRLSRTVYTYNFCGELRCDFLLLMYANEGIVKNDLVNNYPFFNARN